MLPHSLDAQAFSFYKMHVLGNDHLIFQQPISLTSTRIKHLMDRRRGIGADQLIVPHVPFSAFGQQPLRFDIWNQDGSSAAFCGNGAACVASLLSQGPAHISGQPLIFGMGAVDVEAWVHPDREHPLELRLPWGHIEETYLLDLDLPWGVRNVGRIATGNLHTLIELSPAEAEEWAKLAEAAFRALKFSTNVVCWWQDLDVGKRIHLRVWERGVGPTGACGSGALALASFLRHKDRLPGSFLYLHFAGGKVALQTYEEGGLGLCTDPQMSYCGRAYL